MSSHAFALQRQVFSWGIAVFVAGSRYRRWSGKRMASDSSNRL
jgi:hypothetical protein